MKKYLILSILVVLGLPVLLSDATAAQGVQYNEEYMEQHDGGDREEYLQELEYSDPEFYIPPVSNDTIEDVN